MKLEVESCGISFGYQIKDPSGKLVFKVAGSPFVLGSDVTFQVLYQVKKIMSYATYYDAYLLKQVLSNEVEIGCITMAENRITFPVQMDANKKFILVCSALLLKAIIFKCAH